MQITIETPSVTPIGQRRFEHVERKGLGHPDSICDGVAEAVATSLCKAYLDACGRVLHFNADKALLAAGRSTPGFGGGTINAPMQLYLGDRATAEIDGTRIPVGEIAEAAARNWFRRHLRFVDPERHLLVRSVLQAGSAELAGLYTQVMPNANDTSIGVGYAPLSEAERITLAAERRLNTPAWKTRHPEVGEDIKVMTMRHDRCLRLTIAVAIVDRFIGDTRAYFSCKGAIVSELREELMNELRECDTIDVMLNALDDPTLGEKGAYLTVTGTSAEGADSGQVGRGNRVSGLISPHRAMSLEAAAGKNPLSHVGKIYNVLAFQTAQRIVEAIDDIGEATVWICSRIGRPIDSPASVAVEVIPQNGKRLIGIEPAVRKVIEEQLLRIPYLTAHLAHGEIAVF